MDCLVQNSTNFSEKFTKFVNFLVKFVKLLVKLVQIIEKITKICFEKNLRNLYTNLTIFTKKFNF